MMNIADTLAGFGEFQTLVVAAQAAGLIDTLANDGPFTLLAPVDSAFAALPPGVLDTFLNDPASLAELLLYHVIPGPLVAEDIIIELGPIATAHGAPVTFSADERGVLADNSLVIATNIIATNGVIHMIDQVLIPYQYTPTQSEEDSGQTEDSTTNTGVEEMVSENSDNTEGDAVEETAPAEEVATDTGIEETTSEGSDSTEGYTVEETVPAEEVAADTGTEETASEGSDSTEGYAVEETAPAEEVAADTDTEETASEGSDSTEGYAVEEAIPAESAAPDESSTPAQSEASAEMAPASAEEGAAEEMAPVDMESDATAAPDEVPDTGGNFSSSSKTIAVVLLLITMLIGSTFLTRRLRHSDSK